MSHTIHDVAIIGYGPAGATLANLLGQYGLSVLVLEREAGIYPLPRAVHFDGEVMRVFETAGLRDEVEAISRPGLKGMHFNNAAGEDGAGWTQNLDAAIPMFVGTNAVKLMRVMPTSASTTSAQIWVLGWSEREPTVTGFEGWQICLDRAFKPAPLAAVA